MRGEDNGLAVLNPFIVETPPHAWGRRRGPAVHDGASGNTPTCVGKTLLVQNRGHMPEKHPHMRGEDLHAQSR